MDDLLSQALGQLLEDQCKPQLVRAIERGESPATFWGLLEESGFANALVGEEQGGAGLALRNVFELLELCGTYAVPVPLAETMVARALITRAGARPPAGSIALARGTAMDEGGLRCAHVSYGRVADWALVQRSTEWLLLPVALAQTFATVFPLDATLAWDQSALAADRRLPAAQDVQVVQACVTAAKLAGALMSVFNRTLHYANERQQFGRPIGKFQAIQHQLSVLSEHAFAARTAAQIGCQASGCVPDLLRVAVAKARTSEAALEVAALAHSIHGAIGFTEEFDLQLFTRRLHEWRQTAGSEAYWQSELGKVLLISHQGLALDLVRAASDPL
ncbi:MAG: acyl-CoA dehydrogenase [Mesorhizobium sp.]|uniref:acyl-CoA dehydrogenase family protein n=1 Tax=Mesorhizobium sp. TaxID=1871066 RepID=UPI000FE651BC|nr:acyl-CoA dehydrogenase family protein [Mesorhizobium sp.]RWK47240.1 MAG: acyl-CoA dehydrogenase [Mesorhizobium sp.]